MAGVCSSGGRGVDLTRGVGGWNCPTTPNPLIPEINPHAPSVGGSAQWPVGLVLIRLCSGHSKDPLEQIR